MSANGMKPKRTNHVAQMRAEYDFDYSKAERGKYYKRLLKEGSNEEGSNVVVLDRDVAKAFPDSASVNKALRSVLRGKRPRRPTTRSTRTRAKAARTACSAEEAVVVTKAKIDAFLPIKMCDTSFKQFVEVNPIGVFRKGSFPERNDRRAG